jgi:PAS domain S-box-containing protein
MEMEDKNYGEYIKDDDISQLKQKVEEGRKAAKAMRQMEKQFRLMFENSPQPMFIATASNLQFIEVNQAMIDLYGFSEEEFLKMTMKDIHCSTSDKQVRKEIENSHGLFYSTKEATHIKKNGEKIVVEVSLDSVFYKKSNSVHVLINDITEQKRTEEALRKSEEEYRVLFEKMPDGFYRSTPEGYFADANPAFVRMLGYDSKEELLKVYIPTDVYVSTEEDDKSDWTKIKYNDSIKVYRLKTKDGRIIWVEDNSRTVKDERGKVVFYEGFCRDITLRRQSEEKLATEQFLMNMLMDNLPQKIYFKDAASRFIRVNKAHAHKHRFNDPSEAIGKTDFDLFTSEHANQAFNDEQRIIKTGLPIINYEEKETWENRPDTWVSTTKIPMYNKEGGIIGTFGVSFDITDRKLSEQKLRESEEKFGMLFSAMTEIVVLHDLVFDEMGEPIDYRITDCNKKFTEVLGLQKDEVIGKLATEIYRTETAPYFSEYIKVALTGEPINYTTYFAPMDKHFMVAVVSPRKNSFATITTDITELKQVQEEMTVKKNELENYLYIASHDLRSPMVNIQGFSQRLQKQSLAVRNALAACEIHNEAKSGVEKIINEDIPKSLNFILTNVNKMDSLINGLLQLSRTGRVKMNIQKIDMNHLLETVVAGYDHQLAEMEAKVVLNNLPECFGDPVHVNQLFSNLIGNAIKYRDPNRRLLIEINGKQHYNKAIYSIKDNGIGIAHQYIERIWDVFFRIESTSKEAGEGIGLSLVKRIVDKNRGKAWVESEEGKGSIFYIELNRKEFTE